MGKSSTAIIAVATFAAVACEPATSTVTPTASAAKVLLPTQDIFETRLSLDDVVERLLPSIGDANSEANLRIQLAAFKSSLAGGDRVAAQRSLGSAVSIVNDLSERTSTGKFESPEIGAIRIALSQAEASLQKLEKLQTETQK